MEGFPNAKRFEMHRTPSEETVRLETDVADYFISLKLLICINHFITLIKYINL